MQQHDFDPISAFFGLVFVFVAGGYLLTHTTDVHLHWLLAVPAALIALGVVVLGATARRIRRTDTTDQTSTSTTTGA